MSVSFCWERSWLEVEIIRNQQENWLTHKKSPEKVWLTLLAKTNVLDKNTILRINIYHSFKSAHYSWSQRASLTIELKRKADFSFYSYPFLTTESSRKFHFKYYFLFLLRIDCVAFDKRRKGDIFSIFQVALHRVCDTTGAVKRIDTPIYVYICAL